MRVIIEIIIIHVEKVVVIVFDVTMLVNSKRVNGVAKIDLQSWCALDIEPGSASRTIVIAL